LDYLANKHPEALLGGGENMRAQAEARRWSAFFTSDVHASFWPIFVPKRYSADLSKAAQLTVIEAGQRWCRTTSYTRLPS
jgi:glutathione S-transferase